MKKMMTVCLIAMLALGVMGFGFAKWSDTITAEVNVSTGSVLVGILDKGTNDQGPDPNVLPGINSEGKDVASIVSLNSGTAIGNTGYFESITETITNAYPYYAPSTTIEIASLGSVPVKTESLNILWSGALADNIQCAAWTVTYPEYTYSSTGAGSSTIETVTGTTFDALQAAVMGVQLHENDKLTIDLQVYFDQQSEQGASTTGTFTVQASQWNEVL
ncbi:MAG: hypothetical protein PHT62_05950 [Desulfotomaculaceae bacterium]|nr:hypothetical protein [Desulfotomaculaceae bacterium]